MKIYNSLFSLRDKVAVITGGSGVLGGEMSHYLASEGVRVAIIGRDAIKGAEVVAAIEEKGGEAHFFSADVTDRAALCRVREAVIEQWGGVDFLVNAAGGNIPEATITPEQTLFDVTTEAFERVIRLNLMGTILPTQVFAEAMVERGGGSIVNISTVAASRPFTRVMGYSAAKAAVTSFTQSAATELAHKFGDQFRVNAIAPGVFLAEQNRTLLLNSDGSYTDRASRIVEHTPLGRLGRPEELLGALHYLLSGASSYVTGSTLMVDGGFDAFAI